jgi:large conductance mechanosensitive channel
VVKSLVSDVILPVVSLLPLLNRNLEEKFVVLKRGTRIFTPLPTLLVLIYAAGPDYNETISGYNTLKQASADGAVSLAYGSVLFSRAEYLPAR